jgi:hypothetical protein
MQEMAQKRRAGEVREASPALRRGESRAATLATRNMLKQAGTHLPDVGPLATGLLHPPTVGPGRRPTLLPNGESSTGRAKKRLLQTTKTVRWQQVVA